MPKYLTLHPKLRGNRKARLLIPEDKVLLFNDGEDNNAEVILISGQSFALLETMEEVGEIIGVEVKPLQLLTLVDEGNEEAN